MKQIAKSLVIAGALAVAGSAVAEFGDITPYIGADYQQSWMKANGPYSAILPKSFPGATLYVGTKVHENLGFEAGYNWSKTQKKTADIPAGFDGLRNLGLATQATAQPGSKITLRRNSAFFDVVGFLPVMDCVELTGSVGYGYVMPKLSITTSGSTGFDNAGYALRSQHVVRVGLGANYMVTEMVGVRAKLGWESTKATHFKHTAAHDALRANNGVQTRRPLKDSTTLNVGAFVKF